MKKEILTYGFEIPGYSDLYKPFGSTTSFMDADIIVISPKLIYPSRNRYVSFSSGGGCYSIEASSNYIRQIEHLSKEINDSLKMGKTIFLLLSKKENYSLATGVSSPRKGENTYSTVTKTNYDFLPINIGDITSVSGKHISFLGNSTFNDFYKSFKNDLEYQVYLENTGALQTIFTGKDKSKILGAIHQVGTGHIITLPYLHYDEDAFVEYNEEDETNVWTAEAKMFGKKLTTCLVNIDLQLNQISEKTSIPEWVVNKKFTLKKVDSTQKLIKENEQKIESLKSKNQDLMIQLEKEDILKNLLFENGTPLESAVTKALHVLGYQAENYDDGVLELDQIIVSPEKHRFIGECEGKDNKDINITKFRQLMESLNADFAREEVEEKAYGILFGNPQRLEDPKNRKLDFTKKCKIGAEREKVALVKTVDLFAVAKFLEENRNSKFKKACRDAIYKGLGTIVKFPPLPKK